MQTDRNRVRRRALLLIDFQRDFLDDSGRMPIARHQVGRVIFEANRAIEDARSRGDAIVAIGNEFEPHDRLMNLLRRNASIAGSAGAAWDRRIVVDGAAYFSKSRSDAFSNARLAAYLADQRVDEVVLTGVFARACVAATARGALSRGMRARLVESAIGDSSDRAKENALRKLGKHPGVVIESAREDAVSTVRAAAPYGETIVLGSHARGVRRMGSESEQAARVSKRPRDCLRRRHEATCGAIALALGRLDRDGYERPQCGDLPGHRLRRYVKRSDRCTN